MTILSSSDSRSDYRVGYDDGLQEGETRGWAAGREAAAMEVDRSLIRKNITDALSAAIRKLKKP